MLYFLVVILYVGAVLLYVFCRVLIGRWGFVVSLIAIVGA